MKKIFIAVLLALLVVPMIAFAADFRADMLVSEDEVVPDNLYLAGGNPTVNGSVNGDLYVAGGNIVVSGDVTEDLVAAGGNITLTGNVGGDVRVFGGSVLIDGQVGGELLVSGGEVAIGPETTVDNDLWAAGGRVEVAPEAIILGEITIESGEEQGKKLEDFKEPAEAFLSAAFFMGQIFLILSYFVIAALYLGLFPNIVKKISVRAVEKDGFWLGLGLGLLIIIVTPIAALFLIFTGVGAMLGALLFLAYAAYIIVNMVFAGLIFGAVTKKWITKVKKVEADWAWGLGGIAVLHLLTLVPVIGWVIGFVFFLFSVGTMATVQWNVARAVK